ncbi:MAG: VPDSG-CTERM sorting domain-containing protein [Opitutaceae bacterium]
MTRLLKPTLALLILAAPALTALGDNTLSIKTTPFSDPVKSGSTLVGYGGEFTATAPGLDLYDYQSPTGADAGLGLAADQFETFCVELNQDVTAGTAYSYTLSNNIELTKGVTEALPVSVAWLYSQFVSGGLASYGYYYGKTGSGGVDSLTRAESSADLQNVIWELMGETLGVNPDTPEIPTLSDLQTDETSNPNIFLSAVLSNFSDPEQAADGAYGVEVANLVTSSGAVAQNQLTEVPDGGATLALLGVSLLGLVWLKRRSGLAA